MNKMNNKLANRNGQLREIISLKGVLASVSPRVWVIALPIASVNDLANSLTCVRTAHHLEESKIGFIGTRQNY